MSAKLLRLRLLVEGIEIPCVAAQISCGRMTPTQAAIQIVPLDQALEFLPRSYVSLFFYRDDPAGLTAPASCLEDAYKCVFVGEYVSSRYTKSAQGQRAHVLICEGFTSYWDSAKMYFRDGKAMRPYPSRQEREAVFSGAHVRKLPQHSDVTPAGTLYSIIQSSPATIPGMKGLLGGILSLHEAIGGVTRGSARFRGLNDFYTAAELRLRLSQMIGASALDDSSARLLKTTEFRKWIRSTLQRNNRMITFGQIIELLLARVFHQYTTISSPYLCPVMSVTVTKEVSVKGHKKGALPPHYQDLAEKRIGILEGHLKKAEDADAKKIKSSEVAPGTEVVGPQKDPLVDVVKDIPKDGKLEGFDELGSYSLSTRVSFDRSSEADPQVVGALRDFHDALLEDESRDTLTRKMAAKYEYGARVEAVDWGTTKSSTKKTIEKYKRALYGRRQTQTVTETALIDQRLMATVFSPDLWWAAPPKSNVFFPDRYWSFQFSRDHRTEVTRLMLNTKPERVTRKEQLIRDGNQRKVYYAPVIEDVSGTLSKTSARKGAEFIMGHEIFTGIIPVVEHMPDIEAFTPINKDGCKYKDLPYLQRTAIYRFHKLRFASRLGSISCPPDIDVIPGMPCLIIDKYYSDDVQKLYGIEPTQYLALVEGAEHQLHQGGGSTSLSLSHVRTHREQNDFIGKKDYTLLIPEGMRDVSTRASGIASMIPGSELGPDGKQKWTGEVELDLGGKKPVTYALRGEADDVQSVPSGYQLAYAAPGLPNVTGGEATLQGTANPLQRERGWVPPDTWSDEEEPEGVSSLERSSTYPEQWTDTFFPVRPYDVPVEVTIRRKVPRYRREQVRLPFEEVVRPAWISRLYDNLHISGFYQEMFGCSAITDDPARPWGSRDKRTGKPLPRREPSSPCLPAKEAEEEIEAQRSQDILRLVQDGRTIEQSVDRIVKEYRAAVSSELGAGDYVSRFVWRPVVTMRQLLGKDFDPSKMPEKDDADKVKASSTVREKKELAEAEAALVAAEAAQAAQPSTSASTAVADAKARVAKAKKALQKKQAARRRAYAKAMSTPKYETGGEEGFHSRAFGPYDDLDYLDHVPVTGLGGAGKTRLANPKIDPRKKRHERVLKYSLSLRTSKGLLG